MPCLESKVSRGEWECTQWNREGEREREGGVKSGNNSKQTPRGKDREGEALQDKQNFTLEGRNSAVRIRWQQTKREWKVEENMKSLSEWKPSRGMLKSADPTGETTGAALPQWCVQVTRPGGGEEGSSGLAVREEVVFRAQQWGHRLSSAVRVQLQSERRDICPLGGLSTGRSPPRNLSHMSSHVCQRIWLWNCAWVSGAVSSLFASCSPRF